MNLSSPFPLYTPAFFPAFFPRKQETTEKSFLSLARSHSRNVIHEQRWKGKKRRRLARQFSIDYLPVLSYREQLTRLLSPAILTVFQYVHSFRRPPTGLKIFLFIETLCVICFHGTPRVVDLIFLTFPRGCVHFFFLLYLSLSSLSSRSSTILRRLFSIAARLIFSLLKSCTCTPVVRIKRGRGGGRWVYSDIARM